MKEIKQTVGGEEEVTYTTAEYLLLKVRKMYDFVKCMGEDLKIKRFFSTLDEMTEIAREINEKGLLGDEQMLVFNLSRCKREGAECSCGSSASF